FFVGGLAQQPLDDLLRERVQRLLGLALRLAQVVLVGGRRTALDGRRHHADLSALLFETGFHEIAGVHSPSKFSMMAPTRKPPSTLRRNQPATSRNTITVSFRCRPQTRAPRSPAAVSASSRDRARPRPAPPRCPSV